MIAEWHPLPGAKTRDPAPAKMSRGRFRGPFLQIERLKLGSRAVYGSYRALPSSAVRSGVRHDVVSDLSYAQMKL